MVLFFYARVCGCDALRMGTSTWYEVSYLTFLVTWLGTPPAGRFEGLPHWPGHLPQVAEAKPWPSKAQAALGTRGCAFLRGLLRFPPTERSLDLDHVWFHPERLVLGGRCAPSSGFLPDGGNFQARLDRLCTHQLPCPPAPETNRRIGSKLRRPTIGLTTASVTPLGSRRPPVRPGQYLRVSSLQP